MWSGWLLTNKSGALLGVHQKVNRIAKRYVDNNRSDLFFPNIKEILNFEGNNGPDGIKLKSPACDEPWHYYDPYDPKDTKILNLISDHYNALVDSIKNENSTKVAFEAAWLSHAIVDGLTPAHHFPYEQELEKLRGESKETRTTLKKKILINGETKIEMFIKNWQMWGAKGLFLTHGLFEIGIAFIMLPIGYNRLKPSSYDLKEARQLGSVEYFKRKARYIADLNMYQSFYKKGWTTQLARQAKSELIPEITKTVTVIWVLALDEASNRRQLTN